MSQNTTNRGLKKAVGSDIARDYLKTDLAVSLDNLDTHEHDVGDITGQLPIGQIATGTPDGTKFVRDDGILAVPPGTGSGAPTDATYLTTLSNASLSAEVVVGTTPGGELGGTWAAPTVDAVHSGSSHAAIQTAAETTAANALASHAADGTAVHGITDTAALYAAGGTDVAITDGGTGASSAAAARTALGTNDATNLTTGTLPTARWGTGTANSTSFARGDNTFVQLAAADVLSGTFGTARLGSGTANATKYLAGDQTFKTVPVLDTAGVYGPKLYVGSAVPSGAADGDVWLDTFSFLYDPNSGVAPTTTSVPVTNATNSYTRSIQPASVDINGDPTTSVYRIAWTSGTEVNDRRFWTLDDVGTLDDIEVTALLYGRVSAQQGIALRLTNIGNTTTQNAYTIWNDQVSGFAPWWNIGNWKGTDGNFTHTDNGGYVERLESPFEILSMTRASNVVTAVVEPGRDYRVNQSISVVADTTASFTNNSRTLTSVSGDTNLVKLTWAQTGADETATALTRAGVGAFFGGTHTYPHWIKARLVGSTLTAKFWRNGEGEPSWSDARSTYLWSDTTPLGSTGSGKVGILYAHGTSGRRTDWGPISVTRAEKGWKVLTSGVWRSLQPRSL